MAKDIVLKVAFENGSALYTLSPGCTIARSITRDLQVIPIPGGLPAQLITLGSTESDIIRIDARVSVSPNGSDPTQPHHVNIFELASYFKGTRTEFPPDHILWGEGVDIEGRIKNIVITQRPGEGDLVDLAVIFEVGECVASRSD